jgi:hypothetical protein
LTAWRCRRAADVHQGIQDAVAARQRLVLVIGPKAAMSDYVRQEWQFALQAEKAVTPILRLWDHSLVPDKLRVSHAEDFRDVVGAI